MPWRYDNRSDLVERICETVRRGRPVSAVLREPGMPNHRTLSRWAERDAQVRCRLQEAKAEGRAMEARFWRKQPFNAAVAHDLLRQVRFGRRVAELVREPAFPNRDTLDRWRRENPAFAEDLRAAVRFARQETRKPYPYDEARCDRLIQRLNAGATLAELLGKDGFPRKVELKLWRRRVEGLDHAIRMAKLGGHRNRSKARAGPTPELAKRIARRLVEGRSLRQVGQMRDMPHFNTLYGWMRKRREFAAQIQDACEFRDWLLAEKAGDIAETVTPDNWRAAAAQIGAIRRHVAQMSFKPRG